METNYVKVRGTFFFVSVARGCVHKEFVVRSTHLDEFVSLMHPFDSVIISQVVTTTFVFSNKFQWYKSL
jgi:hypothetical protein